MIDVDPDVAADLSTLRSNTTLPWARQEAASRLTARLQEAERERDTALEAMKRWNELWKEVSARAEAAEAREAALREALTWLRMALSWAFIREEPRVNNSNEMRDIRDRLDAALTTPEDALKVGA